MSDDRKERAREADIKKQEPENAVPFVPSDDSANMIAIRAAQRHRATAALFAYSTPFPPIPQEGAGTAQGVGAASAVSATVAAATGIVSLSARSTAMSSGAATLTLMPDWTAFRDELNPRLDAIEAGLRAIAPVIEHFDTAYREHARIGHNNPPEDIDILPIGLAELELGIVAASVARTEINAEHPRLDVLRLCGVVLRRIGGLLSACIKWVGAKGDVFIDAFLKTAAPLAATALVAKLSGINLDVDAVVGKIRHIMELVNLPF